MGLWRDLNDPLVRAIVGSPVGADAASSGTLVERVRVNLVPHAPHTAEGRHEGLLYGEPQDGGEASAFAIAEERRSTYCDSLTCICFDAEVAEVEWPVGRAHMDKNEPNPFDLLNENGAYACALGTCDPEWDCGGHVVEYPQGVGMAASEIRDAEWDGWDEPFADECAYCGGFHYASREWAR